MPLDPQAEAVRDALVAMDSPPLNTLAVADARVNAEALAAMQGDPEPVKETREITIPGPGRDLEIRVHIPSNSAGQPPPLIVYFHGGGWTIGSIDLLDRPCRAIANASGCPVASVDYRLAPEHKFPAAVEDAFAATQWLADHAADFGADPSRTVVAGDSAGGNLAAVTAIQARGHRQPALAAQVLLFPVTAAPSSGFASYDYAGDGYMLTKADMEWFWDNYRRTPADDTDPLAAPLHAADLTGLPPALVVTATYDPLHDEGAEYATRLEQAGTPVTTRNFDGQMHDFLWIMGAVDAGREAIKEIAAFITALP